MPESSLFFSNSSLDLFMMQSACQDVQAVKNLDVVDLMLLFADAKEC